MRRSTCRKGRQLRLEFSGWVSNGFRNLRGFTSIKSHPGIRPRSERIRGTSSSAAWCIAARQLSQLYGAYIFGDNQSSNIWSMRYDGASVSGLAAHRRRRRCVEFRCRSGATATSFSPFAVRREAMPPTKPILRRFRRLIGNANPRHIDGHGAFTNVSTLTPTRYRAL